MIDIKSTFFSTPNMTYYFFTKKKKKKLFNVKQEGFKTFKCLIWGARRAGDQQEV